MGSKIALVQGEKWQGVYVNNLLWFEELTSRVSPQHWFELGRRFTSVNFEDIETYKLIGDDCLPMYFDKIPEEKLEN